MTSVEQPDNVDRVIDLANADQDSIPSLGIVGVTTSKQIEEIIGPLRLPLGIAVAARIPTTSGIETGLQPSDVIHAVNDTFVKSVAEFRSALAQLKPGDPVALLIERGGQIQYVAFNLD